MRAGQPTIDFGEAPPAEKETYAASDPLSWEEYLSGTASCADRDGPSSPLGEASGAMSRHEAMRP